MVVHVLFIFLLLRPLLAPTLFPYTTLFRSCPFNYARAGVAAPRRTQASRRTQAYGSLGTDRKSTRLNSSHRCISYAVFCLKKKRTAGTKGHAGRSGSNVDETRTQTRDCVKR